MKKFRLFLVMLVSLGLVTPAYAANIYKDRYTQEDSSGNWRFNGNINATQGTVTSRKGVELIAAPANTTGTVTIDESGYTYVLTGTTGPAVGGIGYVLTLPTAASGLQYTFTTATNQTLAVRTAAATDIIMFGTSSPTKLTSPASTASTVTLVGGTNRWFVTEMTTPATATGIHDDWVVGAR